MLLALATYSLDNALPPLPSGRFLSLREGRSVVEQREKKQDTTTVISGALQAASADELRSVGGSVWPCAAALCRWMLQHEAAVREKRVLELGAGTGACGLFAAGLGASSALLTDGRQASAVRSRD